MHWLTAIFLWAFVYTTRFILFNTHILCLKVQQKLRNCSTVFTVSQKHELKLSETAIKILRAFENRLDSRLTKTHYANS